MACLRCMKCEIRYKTQIGKLIQRGWRTNARQVRQERIVRIDATEATGPLPVPRAAPTTVLTSNTTGQIEINQTVDRETVILVSRR